MMQARQKEYTEYRQFMDQSSASSQQSTERAVGIEIADSATSLSVYCETPAGPRRRHRRFATPPTPGETLAALHDLIVSAVADSAPANSLPDAVRAELSAWRLGVAIWAHLDRDNGVVLALPQNPGWRNFPLAAELSARTGASVTLESAVNAAAWGEMMNSVATDSASGAGTLLYVHLGREVAATTIHDGRLLIGHRAREEAFGHTTIETVAEGGPRCQCGGYGHLTPIASAQALVRRMIGRASDDDESLARLLTISGGRAEALTALQVVQLAGADDLIAEAIVVEALDALALGLANAALLLAPDLIIIGGPLAETGDLWLEPLRTRIAALLGHVSDAPTLRMGTLEPFAALVGARALALRDQ